MVSGPKPRDTMPTIRELRDELRYRNLPTTGDKSKLVARCAEASRGRRTVSMRRRAGGYGMQVTECLTIRGYTPEADGTPGAAEIAQVPCDATILSVGGYTVPTDGASLRRQWRENGFGESKFLDTSRVVTRTDLKHHLQRLEAVGVDEIILVLQLPPHLIDEPLQRPPAPPSPPRTPAGNLNAGNQEAGGIIDLISDSEDEDAQSQPQQPVPHSWLEPSFDFRYERRAPANVEMAAAAAAVAGSQLKATNKPRDQRRPGTRPRVITHEAPMVSEYVGGPTSGPTGASHCCPHCSRQYSRAAALSRHIPSCTFATTAAEQPEGKRNGLAHSLGAAGESKSQCGHCGRVYARVDGLRRHSLR